MRKKAKKKILNKELPVKNKDADLRKQIVKVLSQITRIPINEMCDDVLIREEVGIDSLRSIEVISWVEKQLGITVCEREISDVKKVGEFINYLLAELNRNEKNK